MIEYKAKKLFNNHVSIRDYIVKKAIRNKETIRVTHERKEMIISMEHLKRAISTFHAKEFKSAFGDKTYKLYDFVWREKEDKPENNNTQLELF